MFGPRAVLTIHKLTALVGLDIFLYLHLDLQTTARSEVAMDAFFSRTRLLQ